MASSGQLEQTRASQLWGNVSLFAHNVCWRDTQFTIAFMMMVIIVLEVIAWYTETIVSLDRFYLLLRKVGQELLRTVYIIWYIYIYIYTGTFLFLISISVAVCCWPTSPGWRGRGYSGSVEWASARRHSSVWCSCRNWWETALFSVNFLNPSICSFFTILKEASTPKTPAWSVLTRTSSPLR